MPVIGSAGSTRAVRVAAIAAAPSRAAVVSGALAIA
jgi:hypothetical protein